MYHSCQVFADAEHLGKVESALGDDWDKSAVEILRDRPERWAKGLSTPLWLSCKKAKIETLHIIYGVARKRDLLSAEAES
jgi:hypothetical protein